MIPGSASPFFLGSSLAVGGGGAGYQIERSLRFNSSDSAYLSRTPGTASNRKTWTWAGWVKRSALGGTQRFFIGGATSAGGGIQFSSDAIEFFDYPGSYTWDLITTQVFRDTSAWYHILASIDTTQATSSNRAKVYVNGTQVTAFSTSSYPTLNYDGYVNSTVLHTLSSLNGTGDFFSGYLADVHFIDGQALTPSSFTEVSATTGQLIPKAYTGSYGTNGFQLKFADNSSNTATTLGKDTSGNGNNWTPNNFSVSNLLYYVSYGAGLDGYIPAGWQRTEDPNNVFVNNQVGVMVGPDGNSYFAITATSSTITIKWIVYDGSGTYNPTVSLSTSRWSGTVFPSVSGAGSTGSPAVGTYSVTIGNTYYVRTGLTGNGNPALIVYVTGATLGLLGQNPGNDSLVDTPTSYGTDTGVGGEVRGNYATLNPLDTGPSSTLSNGNLSFTYTGGASHRLSTSTIHMSSGKWYWEGTYGQGGTAGSSGFGIAKQPINLSDSAGQSNAYVYHSNGNKYVNGSGSAFGATYTTGDIIGIAFNADTGELFGYKNGILQGTITTGLTTGPYFAIANSYNSSSWDLNFGQRAFAYTAPSGFKALCDTNLPAPLTAKPNTLMDVKLYTGNGSTQTISGLNFSPDFAWFKVRNNTSNHTLYDIVRGATKSLCSSNTNAEATEGGGLSAFTSDGFSLSGDNTVQGSTNANGGTYVAWTWDAGTSTVTNTQGSITSQVRANVSAGFSVVTYTGSSAGSTVGHGLGVAPAFIIGKRRDGASEWSCYHQSLGNAQQIQLNLTAAAGNSSTWNSTSPTSSVISLGAAYSVNFPSYTHVLYCFAPVVGYSSMGSYVGNGSADGPFVYTGFRPSYLLIKQSSTSGQNWEVRDYAREPYNDSNRTVLFPSSSLAEVTDAFPIDFLSNGFKVRNTGDGTNGSGATYIYYAVAENPFQYARAR